MSAKHTPTPLVLKPSVHEGHWEVYRVTGPGQLGYTLFTSDEKEFAESVISAVNAYEKLKADKAALVAGIEIALELVVNSDKKPANEVCMEMVNILQDTLAQSESEARP